MFGTYVMHLDIGESSNEVLQIIYRYPSVGTMKLGKTQKYGKLPCKNCEYVNFY